MKHLLYTLIPVIMIGQGCVSHTGEKEMAAADTITNTACGLYVGDKMEKRLDFGDPTRYNNVYSYADFELKNYEDEFYRHFRYDEDGKSPLDSTQTRVRVGDLLQLLKSVQAEPNYDPQSGDISGLKMHFGMKEKALVILFETAVLKPKGSGEYQSNPSGKYWRAENDGKLSAVEKKEYDDLIAAYRSPDSKIYIRHIDPADSTKFINSDDFKVGDIRDCVMPFQQIFRMYEDNGGPCSVPGDEMLHFTIVASDYYTGSDNFKTHIVAHYKIGEMTEEKNTFKGLGADFSQMSPPNLNNIIRLPNEIVNATLKAARADSLIKANRK